MKLVSVVLDIPTHSFDALLWYAASQDDLAEVGGAPVQATLDDVLGAAGAEAPKPEVGCAVVVPLGGRAAMGFVVGCIEVSGPEDPSWPTGLTPSGLREVREVAGSGYFTPIGAQCARFLSERYLAPLSSCVRLLLPPGGVPHIEKVDGVWQVCRPAVRRADERWVRLLPAAAQFTPRKGAVRQERIIKALQQGDLRVAELTAEYGNVSSALKSLERQGVVEVEMRRRFRAGRPSDAFSARVRPRPSLNADQRRALDSIADASRRKGGRVVLVDGVTGSGKTEVYLHAIEEVLKTGAGAIVLVPEISLTPQTVARFRGRFGDTVAVLHSRMSAGERFDQWDLVRTGAARVVVGARSALFAPMGNVGIIVIDEEHESSYKQDLTPRYVTRDVARWLAGRHDAVLVLGSATPSIEALACAQGDPAWSRVALPARANGKPLPKIQVVDMAREFGGGHRSMFSRDLQAALIEVLGRGQKAVLMLNQRGFAQFLLCRDCGFVPTCDSCSTSLTYHEREAKLVCHHCGAQGPVPARCPECASPYLRRFGAGTQRVEDELRGILADVVCDVVRMDADTTAKKGAHQALLERFAQPGPAVLLGTQMIAKGLDFDEVTLVGVVNADTQLRLPDFRAAERTFDLIEQVAGRSGRGEIPGKVIVQTYSARDVAIRAAATYDRQLFLDSELKLRQNLGYPPFRRLANILAWGRDEDEVRRVICGIYDDLRGFIPPSAAVELLPPTACVLSRLKGSWRYHILMKVPPEGDVAQMVGPYFRRRVANPRVRVSIDIDPVSLL